MSLSTIGRLSYISSTDNKDTWEAAKVKTRTLQAVGEEVRARPDLEIPINQPVGFKVVVVFAKRIDQLFGHLRGKTTKTKPSASRSAKPEHRSSQGG